MRRSELVASRPKWCAMYTYLVAGSRCGPIAALVVVGNFRVRGSQMGLESHGGLCARKVRVSVDTYQTPHKLMFKPTSKATRESCCGDLRKIYASVQLCDLGKQQRSGGTHSRLSDLVLASRDLDLSSVKNTCVSRVTLKAGSLLPCYSMCLSSMKGSTPTTTLELRLPESGISDYPFRRIATSASLTDGVVVSERCSAFHGASATATDVPTTSRRGIGETRSSGREPLDKSYQCGRMMV